MNLYRLTVSNLQHIVDTLQHAKEEKQIILYAAAVVELARRKLILGLK